MSAAQCAMTFKILLQNSLALLLSSNLHKQNTTSFHSLLPSLPSSLPPSLSPLPPPFLPPSHSSLPPFLLKGCAMSGLIADSRTMVDKARVDAQNHWFVYNEPMSVESVTQSVSNLAMMFGEDEDSSMVRENLLILWITLLPSFLRNKFSS